MTLSIKSRRSAGWIAAVAAVTMAVLLASVAVAQASISLSPAGPYRNGDVVTVTGSVPGTLRTVTHYSVAECNLGAALGTRCAQTTASRLLAIGTYASPGYNLTVLSRFTDWDFTTMRAPGTSTTCRGRVGSQCGVVVSYYDSSGGPPVQLGGESTSITF